jgi:hypothetical protein
MCNIQALDGRGKLLAERRLESSELVWRRRRRPEFDRFFKAITTEMDRAPMIRPFVGRQR